MAGYIGTKAAVVTPGAERKKVFSITTTTTSLTGLAYTPGFVHVFHNGVRLVDGTDYTATNGTSLTLTTAAENGDEVVVVSLGTFQVADAYTKAEADGRYVKQSIFSNRNHIINGNFDVWQRGTSFSTAGYGADRWVNGFVGSSPTQSRQSFTLGQTDVPNEPKYFCRSTVTSSAGASNHAILYQPIEGVRTFAGQTCTVSFWAKADASKDIAVEFSQNFGTGGSPSSDVTGVGVTTFSLTTSWQKFTATVSVPSISGKTLGTNDNDQLIVIFWFDAGSDFNARTNSLGQQSGTFDIAQVQLEVGDTATQFEHRSIGQEFALCQRYCQVYNDPPLRGVVLGANLVSRAAMTFVNPMRTAPTLVLTGNAPVWDGNATTTFGSANISATYVTANSLELDATTASAVLTGGRPASIYYSSASSTFTLSAEL